MKNKFFILILICRNFKNFIFFRTINRIVGCSSWSEKEQNEKLHITENQIESKTRYTYSKHKITTNPTLPVIKEEEIEFTEQEKRMNIKTEIETETKTECEILVILIGQDVEIRNNCNCNLM